MIAHTRAKEYISSQGEITNENMQMQMFDHSKQWFMEMQLYFNFTFMSFFNEFFRSYYGRSLCAIDVIFIF